MLTDDEEEGPRRGADVATAKDPKARVIEDRLGLCMRYHRQQWKVGACEVFFLNSQEEILVSCVTSGYFGVNFLCCCP